MTDRPVLVFDSGIGGLPYLAPARQLLPGHSFVYVADHENFPYGEKSASDLRRKLLLLVQRLIERENPAVVLVACNTASVVALAELRERFAVPFVGVVPAVKPAAGRTRTRRIGVLATARTVEQRYLRDLVRQFAGECVVTSVAAGEIVRLVEKAHGTPHPDAVCEVVEPALRRLNDAAVDTVVLGCTHFIFLLPQLQRLFGPRVTIVDSRDGVTRRLQRVVVQRCVSRAGHQRSDKRHISSDRFYTTGSHSPQLVALADRFGFSGVSTL